MNVLASMPASGIIVIATIAILFVLAVLLLFYYNVLDMIPVVFIPLQAEQQVLKFVTHSLEQTTL